MVALKYELLVETGEGGRYELEFRFVVDSSDAAEVGKYEFEEALTVDEYECDILELDVAVVVVAVDAVDLNGVGVGL